MRKRPFCEKRRRRRRPEHLYLTQLLLLIECSGGRSDSLGRRAALPGDSAAAVRVVAAVAVGCADDAAGEAAGAAGVVGAGGTSPPLKLFGNDNL